MNSWENYPERCFSKNNEASTGSYRSASLNAAISQAISWFSSLENKSFLWRSTCSSCEFTPLIKAKKSRTPKMCIWCSKDRRVDFHIERLRICWAIFQKGREHKGDLELPQCLQWISKLILLCHRSLLSPFMCCHLLQKKKKNLWQAFGLWPLPMTHSPHSQLESAKLTAPACQLCNDILCWWEDYVGWMG